MSIVVIFMSVQKEKNIQIKLQIKSEESENGNFLDLLSPSLSQLCIHDILSL